MEIAWLKGSGIAAEAWHYVAGSEIPMERSRLGAMRGQQQLSWKLEDIRDAVTVGCLPR